MPLFPLHVMRETTVRHNETGVLEEFPRHVSSLASLLDARKPALLKSNTGHIHP